jgi:hypothetical protein
MEVILNSMNTTLDQVSEALEAIRLTCPFNQFAAYNQLNDPALLIDPKLGGGCIEMNKRLQKALDGIISEGMFATKCGENSYHIFTIIVVDCKEYLLDPFTQQISAIPISTRATTEVESFPKVGKKSYKAILDYDKITSTYSIRRQRATGIYDANSHGIVGSFIRDNLQRVDINTYNPPERLYGKGHINFRVSLASGANTTIRYPDFATNSEDTSIQCSTDEFPSNIKYDRLFRPRLEVLADQLELSPEDIIYHIRQAIPLINAQRSSYNLSRGNKSPSNLR